MKLKLDAEGRAIVQDGKPVYILDDGTEIAFDAKQSRDKIRELNGEAKTNRERAELAEAGLQVFKGLDPDKAKNAIETLSKMDQKQLMDSGEVDKVKSAIEKSFTDQIKEIKTALEREKEVNSTTLKEKENQIYGLMVSSRFGTSKFVNDNLAAPSDMLEATFGPRYKVESGKLVAYDASGKQIYSRVNPGELADFDEALEIIVGEYPHKERILKSKAIPGGGMNPAASSGRLGTDTSKMSPTQKLRHARENPQQ